MTPLRVMQSSGDWHAVKEYVAARRAELLDQMDDLLADDKTRRDAAVRRDELALLLAAPGETAQAEALADGGERSFMRTY